MTVVRRCLVASGASLALLASLAWGAGRAHAGPAPVAGSGAGAGAGASPAFWADGPADGMAPAAAPRVAFPSAVTTVPAARPTEWTSYAAPCAPCAPCDPCGTPRRGPIEVRDGYLLAQPFLTLCPVSPDTLGCGTTSLRIFGTWSNTFGWRQSSAGENPVRRSFLVDGESRTIEVIVARGITNDVDIGVRMPLHWRGGGVSDDWIDTFHDSLSFLGISANKRPSFRRDLFRINGRRTDGGTFFADDQRGSGLGNIEVFGKWRFRDGGRDGWSWSAIARATAPTGIAPFDAPGVEGALQVVGAKRIADRWDLFVGVGGIGRTDTEFQGMPFADVVGHAFVAAEYRIGPKWSLIAQSDYSTTLSDGIEIYDKDRWYLDFGAKHDLAHNTTLEMGFVENLISQQTTVDFGLHVGIEFRL